MGAVIEERRSTSDQEDPPRIDEPTNEYEASNYPNSYCDPDPLPSSASESQRSAYLIKINTMGEETLRTYKEIELEGEDLWLDFISVHTQ